MDATCLALGRPAADVEPADRVDGGGLVEVLNGLLAESWTNSGTRVARVSESSAIVSIPPGCVR